MDTLDLDRFGPWRHGICAACETLQLVTGPEDGEQRCGSCWRGEEPARLASVDEEQTAPLFDPAPYQRRGEGA